MRGGLLSIHYSLIQIIFADPTSLKKYDYLENDNIIIRIKDLAACLPKIVQTFFRMYAKAYFRGDQSPQNNFKGACVALGIFDSMVCLYNIDTPVAYC